MRISGKLKDTDLSRHFVRGENALENIRGEGSMGKVYEAKHLPGYRPLVGKVVPFGHNQPYQNTPMTSVDLHYMPLEYFIVNGKEQSREWEKDEEILLSTINVCKEVLIGKKLRKRTHAPFAHHFANYPVISEGKFYIMTAQADAPGNNVEDIIETSEMHGHEIGRVLYDVSHGIDILREEGIVHRDLKPGNIHFASACYFVDSRGRPIIFPPETRILDFSIATLTEDDIYERKKDSRENFIALSQQIERQLSKAPGTVCYMSPEQVCGKPLSSDSDLYALGEITYELLTGELPFEFDEKDDDEKQKEKVIDELACRPGDIQKRAVKGLYHADRPNWIPAVGQLLSPIPKVRRQGQDKLRELALKMIHRQPEVHRDLLC